ncbi:Zn(2)-C6 fungal-type domain-containing protein [Trichoderma simmonsii]|uniref:Zn(2)-C6 fungal-type domain-containing protein n=1 Tax=Trichoderma simmonsii TaxID=1491479 RepID=A0A8G0LF08_9HYPO|nr:Zn(2)-C6 fungal-type domain-containing protein [Trichoderma simmonsii]
MPKLRTKTGCLTCRKRRKKCDETRERCKNCSRNALECIWPSKEQEKDRRHLPRSRQSTDEDGGGDELNALVGWDRPGNPIHELFFNTVFSPSAPLSPKDSLFYTVPPSLSVVRSNVEEPDTTVLLVAFANEFLPGRIHPGSHPRYLDFSYAYDMALSSPPLLNACLACATSALGTKYQVANAELRAERFYAKSIHALRGILEEGGCEGSEDWLLATVVILCLYENRRPGYDPVTAAAHIAAAGQVFRKRAITKMSAAATVSSQELASSQTWSAIILERIFTESFLYHCMVMSVQDSNLTPLQDQVLRNVFDDYYDSCLVSTSPEPENWPILGMHYQIIRLFSDLLATLDDTPACCGLGDIIEQLGTWENTSQTDKHGVHILLYISAAKLLAYQHLADSSSDTTQYQSLLQQELENCKDLLPKIDVTVNAFSRYFIWPLAIIERVIQDPTASLLVQQKLKNMENIDPAGKRAYDWVAEGFERRFKGTGQPQPNLGVVLTAT